SSATSTTRSAEPRTAHWISPFPSGPSARSTRAFQPSRRSRAGRTSSCPASTHCATSPHSAVRRITMRARTYNQSHVARAHTGGRRISIYWTWSYPWESQRDPAEIYNRFSTMTEVRNVAWPAYETPEYDAANFLQGIAGTLELFHRSTLSFQELAEAATDHPVAV